MHAEDAQKPDPFAIPEELVEQTERGNVLLFVGERVVRDRHGQNFHGGLTNTLAARCGLNATDLPPFPDIARAYEKKAGRHALVEFVRTQFETLDDVPQAIHTLLARMDMCSVFATTCVDQHLERAFRAAQRPCDPIIAQTDVPFGSEHRTQLYKLHGSLDQADSLILTSKDLERFEDKRSISIVLQSYLTQKTILFLGYDLADPSFRRLYRVATKELDAYSRRSYAVFDSDPSMSVQMWCDDNHIDIITADVVAFLTLLIQRVRDRNQVPTFSVRVPAISPPEHLPEEPYKLLDYYEAKDEPIFFGRDQEIRTLTALIHAHRLTLLYGASGVGKTSLLLAGVMPRLERADPPYTAIYVRALDDPARTIRRTLGRRLPQVAFPETALLVDVLAAAMRNMPGSLVIILDQFEEFFIRHSSQIRADFIDNLGAVYDAHDMPVKLVISLREDWLAAINELEPRIPEIFRTRMRILPLAREQARQAIVAPAERLGIAYETDVVEHLLTDLGMNLHTEILPPQLQIVCGALYRGISCSERTITLKAYEQLGGVRSLLRQYLWEELDKLLVEDRRLAQAILEELVTSKETKAVKATSELAYGLHMEAQMLLPVLDRLVRARLVRPLEREDGKQSYELAHEYLIREIELSDTARQRKEAEEIIQQRYEMWQRRNILIDQDTFEILRDQRGTVLLTSEQTAFMLRCALRHNQDIHHWVLRLGFDNAYTVASILFADNSDALADERLNALEVLAFLPREQHQELLYQQVFYADEEIAHRALMLLCDLPIEGVIERLRALLQQAEDNLLESFIRALAVIDRPEATDELSVMLTSLSEEDRVEVIDQCGYVVKQYGVTDVQRLLVRTAVLDDAEAVRAAAQEYIGQISTLEAIRVLFDLALPSYKNYKQYLKKECGHAPRLLSPLQHSRQLFKKARAIWHAFVQPEVLSHNRALHMVSNLNKDASDMLLLQIEYELRKRPPVSERIIGFLATLPALIFVLLLIIAAFISAVTPTVWQDMLILQTGLFLDLSTFFIFVVFPLVLDGIISTFLFYKKNLHQKRWLARLLPDYFRHFIFHGRRFILTYISIPVVQSNTCDFLRAQGIIVRFYTIAIVMIFISSQLQSLLPWPYVTFLYTILSVSGVVVYILGVIFHVIAYLKTILFWKRKIPARNDWCWFSAGSGRSIRWFTARTVLCSMKLVRLKGSLQRLSVQNDRDMLVVMPQAVTALIRHAIAKEPDMARAYASRLRQLTKDLRQHTVHDEPVSDRLQALLRQQQRQNQLADKIERRADSKEGRRNVARRQVRRRLFFFLSWIAFGVAFLWIAVSIGRTLTPIDWHVHFNAYDADSIWISKDTYLYQAALSNKEVPVEAQSIFTELPVKTVACAPLDGTCYVFDGTNHIGIVHDTAIEWKWDLSRVAIDIHSFWVTQQDGNESFFWIHADNRLLVSSILETELSWDEHPQFRGVIINGLQPVNGQEAVVIATHSSQVLPETQLVVQYYTDNGGSTWNKADTVSYTWTHFTNTLTTVTNSSVANSSESLSVSLPITSTLNVLSAPDQSVFFAYSSNIWRSVQKEDWQEVFAIDQSPGNRACGMQFGTLHAVDNARSTFLYRSYSFLDAERGLYISQDMGDTWRRIVIFQADSFYKTSPLYITLCGEQWNRLENWATRVWHQQTE